MLKLPTPLTLIGAVTVMPPATAVDPMTRVLALKSAKLAAEVTKEADKPLSEIASEETGVRVIIPLVLLPVTVPLTVMV